MNVFGTIYETKVGHRKQTTAKVTITARTNKGRPNPISAPSGNFLAWSLGLAKVSAEE